MIFNDKKVAVGGRFKAYANALMYNHLPNGAFSKVFIDEVESKRLFNYAYDPIAKTLHAIEAYSLEDVSGKIDNVYRNEYDVSTYTDNPNETSMAENGYHRMIMKPFETSYATGNNALDSVAFEDPYMWTYKGVYGAGLCKVDRAVQVCNFTKHTAENINILAVTKDSPVIIELDTRAVDIKSYDDNVKYDLATGLSKTIFLDTPLNDRRRSANTPPILPKLAARYAMTFSVKPCIKLYNASGAFVLCELPGLGITTLKINTDNTVSCVYEGTTKTIGTIAPLVSEGFKVIKFSVVAKECQIEYRNWPDISKQEVGDEQLMTIYPSFAFEYMVKDVYSTLDDKKTYQPLLDSIQDKLIGSFAWPYIATQLAYKDINATDNALGTDFDYKDGVINYKNVTQEEIPAYIQSTFSNSTTWAGIDISVLGMPKIVQDMTAVNYKLTAPAYQTNKAFYQDRSYVNRMMVPVSKDIDEVRIKFKGTSPVQSVMLPFEESYSYKGINPANLIPPNQVTPGSIYAVNYQDRYYKIKQYDLFKFASVFENMFFGAIQYIVADNVGNSEIKSEYWVAEISEIKDGVVFLKPGTVLKTKTFPFNAMKKASVKTPMYDNVVEFGLPTDVFKVNNTTFIGYKCTLAEALCSIIIPSKIMAYTSYQTAPITSRYVDPVTFNKQDVGFNVFVGLIVTKKNNTTIMSNVIAKLDENNCVKVNEDSQLIDCTKLDTFSNHMQETLTTEYGVVSTTNSELQIEYKLVYTGNSDGSYRQYELLIKGVSARKSFETISLASLSVQTATSTTFINELKLAKLTTPVMDTTIDINSNVVISNKIHTTIQSRSSAVINVALFGLKSESKPVNIDSNLPIEARITKTKIEFLQNDAIIQTEVFQPSKVAAVNDVLDIVFEQPLLNAAFTIPNGMTGKYKRLGLGSLGIDSIKFFSAGTEISKDIAISEKKLLDDYDFNGAERSIKYEKPSWTQLLSQPIPIDNARKSSVGFVVNTSSAYYLKMYLENLSNIKSIKVEYEYADAVIVGYPWFSYSGNWSAFDYPHEVSSGISTPYPRSKSAVYKSFSKTIDIVNDQTQITCVIESESTNSTNPTVGESIKLANYLKVSLPTKAIAGPIYVKNLKVYGVDSAGKKVDITASIEGMNDISDKVTFNSEVFIGNNEKEDSVDLRCNYSFYTDKEAKALGYDMFKCVKRGENTNHIPNEYAVSEQAYIGLDLYHNVIEGSMPMSETTSYKPRALVYNGSTSYGVTRTFNIHAKLKLKDEEMLTFSLVGTLGKDISVMLMIKGKPYAIDSTMNGKILFNKITNKIIVVNNLNGLIYNFDVQLDDIIDLSILVYMNKEFRCGLSSLFYSGEVIERIMSADMPENLSSLCWLDADHISMGIVNKVSAMPNGVSSTIIAGYLNDKTLVRMSAVGNDTCERIYHVSLQHPSSSIDRNRLIRRLEFLLNNQSKGYFSIGKAKFDLQPGVHKYNLSIYTLNSYSEMHIVGNENQYGSVWCDISVDDGVPAKLLCAMTDEVPQMFLTSQSANVSIDTWSRTEPKSYCTVPVSITLDAKNSSGGHINIVKAKALKPITKLDWNAYIYESAKLLDINTTAKDAYMIIGIDNSIRMKGYVDQIAKSLLSVFESSSRYGLNMKVAVGLLENGMYIDQDGNEVDDQPIWLDYSQSVAAIRHRQFAIHESLELEPKTHGFVKEAVRFLSIYPGDKSIRLFTEKPANDLPITENTLSQTELEDLKAQLGFGKMMVAALLPKVTDQAHEMFDYIRKLGIIYYPSFKRDILVASEGVSASGINVNTKANGSISTDTRIDLINLLTGNQFEGEKLNSVSTYTELFAPVIVERMNANRLVDSYTSKAFTANSLGAYVATAIDESEQLIGYKVQNTAVVKDWRVIPSAIESTDLIKRHFSNLVVNSPNFDEYYRKNLAVHDMISNVVVFSLFIANFTEEQKAKAKSEMIEILKSLKVGDEFTAFTVNGDPTPKAEILIKKTKIYSEKKRRAIIETISGFEFQEAEWTNKAHFDIGLKAFILEANKELLTNGKFRTDRSNIMHCMFGDIMIDRATEIPFTNVTRNGALSSDTYQRLTPITYLHGMSKANIESILVTENMQRAFKIYEERRPLLGKTTLRLTTPTANEVAEAYLGGVEHSESSLPEDKLVYVKFTGKAEKQDTQLYHVGIIAYGKLFCFKLDDVMKSYDIIINNPHHNDFDGKAIIEAFRQPEENLNPMLIEKCPFMIIEDYNSMDVENKLHGKHGVVYAKDASIIIDEIYFDPKSYGFKSFIPDEPIKQELPLSEVIVPDAAMPPNPEPEKYDGKTEDYPVQPDVPPWVPSYNYPSYPMVQVVTPNWTYTANNGQVYGPFSWPQWAPNMSQEQKDKWIEKKLKEAGINLPPGDPIFNESNWAANKDNKPVNKVAPEAPPLYIQMSKQICSDVYDFTLPKPGSYKVSDVTAEELITPYIIRDEDIQNSMNYNLKHWIVSLVPKTNYPFEEEFNPYSPEKARPIGPWASDIYAIAGAYSPHHKGMYELNDLPNSLKSYVYIAGGYVGQKFEGHLEKAFRLSQRSGLVPVLRKQELSLTLKNVYDKMYDGDPMSIVQNVNVIHPDEIIINTMPKEDTVLRAEAVTVLETQTASYTFTDDTQTQSIKLVDEFEIPDYESELAVVIKQESNNVFVNDILVNVDDKVFVNKTDNINMRVGHHVEWEPWESKVITKQYVLNGDNHTSKPLAGRKDVLDSIGNLELPIGLRAALITAHTDCNKPLTFSFMTPISAERPMETEVTDDVYKISTDYTESIPFSEKWTGPTVVSDKFYTKERFSMEVPFKLKNPQRTMVIDGTLSNLKLSVASNNPNIKVLEPVVDLDFYNMPEKTVSTKVKPFSTEVAKWNPKLMPGFYYFNNEERYLFVETEIKKGQKEEQVYVSKDINLTVVIKMNDNRLFNVQLVMPLLYNQEIQFYSKNLIADDLYPNILSFGYKPENVIDFSVTASEDVILEYDISGRSKLGVKSKGTETYTGKSKYFDFNNKAQCIVSPIPKQYAPVILTDVRGNEYREVNFRDIDGKLSLEHTESPKPDGSRNILLTFEGIDKDSIILKINDKAITEYELYNNVLVVKNPVDPSDKVNIKYKLKHSFFVDYNYDVESNQAMIVCHSERLDDIIVRYETSEEPYAIVEDIELNSIFNPVHEGFMFVCDDETFTSKIEVMINPTVIGVKEAASFYIKASDEKSMAVQGDVIILNAKYGNIELESNKTDKNGIVSGIYKAPGFKCQEELTVIDIDANITKVIQLNVI